MKNASLVCLFLAASACVSVRVDDLVSAAAPPSPQARARIVEAARDALLDPYSVRDAEISYVGVFQNGLQFVCVRANAKNAFGGYTGRDTLAVYMKDNVPTGSGRNPQLCNNANLRWTKFQELEDL